MTFRPAPLLLIALVAGFVLWSIGFVAVYAVHSLACAAGAGLEGARWLTGLVWVLHLAAHAGLLAWMWRRLPGREAAGEGAGFMRAAALALAAAAGAAAFWTGLPVVFVAACR